MATPTFDPALPFGDPLAFAEQRIQIHFGDWLDLVGYSLDAPRVAPGAEMLLTLYWRANGQLERDYRAFPRPRSARASLQWRPPTSGRASAAIQTRRLAGEPATWSPIGTCRSIRRRPKARTRLDVAVYDRKSGDHLAASDGGNQGAERFDPAQHRGRGLVLRGHCVARCAARDSLPLVRAYQMRATARAKWLTSGPLWHTVLRLIGRRNGPAQRPVAANDACDRNEARCWADLGGWHCFRDDAGRPRSARESATGPRRSNRRLADLSARRAAQWRQL